MEYFLKDSYHTLLWRLESAFSPVIALKLKKNANLCPVYYSPRASPFSFSEAMGFHRASNSSVLHCLSYLVLEVTLWSMEIAPRSVK